MKTIAEMLVEWKSIRIPIVVGCEYTFEKECNIEITPKYSVEYEITLALRDKFTHRNGVYAGWAHVAVFLTEHQNDKLRSMENQQFYEFLRKFTEDGVNFRRKELCGLREAGEIINYQPIL